MFYLSLKIEKSLPWEERSEFKIQIRATSFRTVTKISNELCEAVFMAEWKYDVLL